MKPIVAQNACAREPLPAGSGFAATSTPAIPPAIRMSRPGAAAGLSARPVTTSQTPTASSTSVITHRSAAPSAARALMVLATALNERGCSLAATVHPPTKSTGAAAEETTPHQGTTRTTTTIGGPRSAASRRPASCTTRVEAPGCSPGGRPTGLSRCLDEVMVALFWARPVAGPGAGRWRAERPVACGRRGRDWVAAARPGRVRRRIQLSRRARRTRPRRAGRR